MALYDNNNYYGTPWYAPTKTAPIPTYASGTPTTPVQQTYPTPNQINQFVWINNPSVVDMWPVAAGSEMTFINNEEMMLYVKRVDEYNHPLKIRKFKLTEVLEDESAAGNSKEQNPINMEELKSFLSSEIEKSVSSKLSNMFTVRGGESHD